MFLFLTFCYFQSSVLNYKYCELPILDCLCRPSVEHPRKKMKSKISVFSGLPTLDYLVFLGPGPGPSPGLSPRWNLCGPRFSLIILLNRLCKPSSLLIC